MVAALLTSIVAVAVEVAFRVAPSQKALATGFVAIMRGAVCGLLLHDRDDELQGKLDALEELKARARISGLAGFPFEQPVPFEQPQQARFSLADQTHEAAKLHGKVVARRNVAAHGARPSSSAPPPPPVGGLSEAEITDVVGDKPNQHGEQHVQQDEAKIKDAVGNIDQQLPFFAWKFKPDKAEIKDVVGNKPNQQSLCFASQAHIKDVVGKANQLSHTDATKKGKQCRVRFKDVVVDQFGQQCRTDAQGNAAGGKQDQATMVEGIIAKLMENMSSNTSVPEHELVAGLELFLGVS